ncbi:hypothetical protein LTR67_007674 [Exophiala xenobiotica]
MSPHISNLPLRPTSSIPIEDQHHLSRELTGCSENPSRADQAREQTVQETEDENPDSMDVQEGEPGEPDLDLDLDLDLISENLPVPQQLQVQVQVPTKALVTILPWEDALFNSQTTARLLPHLPPYEHSFWMDSVLCGPRPSRIKGCGLSIVHRRLDKSSPETRDFAILWEQELFVARNVHDHGRSQMLAVVQALAMAVDQCERISGIPVTKARIKEPGAAAELKRCAAKSPWCIWPMPKVVNVFTSNQSALNSIACYWGSDWQPGRRSPLCRVNELIEALMALGVRVRLQWVPGVVHDARLRWPRGGARNALKPQYQNSRALTGRGKPVRRVFCRGQKDRDPSRTFTAKVQGEI